MNSTHNLHHGNDLRYSISAMIDQHGTRRVLLAALRAMLKPPPTQNKRRRIGAMNNHLRRDIGLPPVIGQPPHWKKYH